MVVRGRVQNGVIVLDEGARLPEGQDVIVLGSETVSATPLLPSSPPHSVLDIPTVSVGSILRRLADDDDLLGETLDTRP